MDKSTNDKWITANTEDHQLVPSQIPFVLTVESFLQRMD